jgi:hypothetical protein
VTGERAALSGIALLLAAALGVVTANLLSGEPRGPAAAARQPNPLLQIFPAVQAMEAAASPPAATPRPAPPDEPPLQPGHVHVCGLGQVRADADASGLGGVPAGLKAATHAHLRDHFAAHDSERVRAAGFVLELATARAGAAEAVRARQPACEEGDPACEARLQALAGSAADAVGAEPIRQLGRLAMATTDPFVYAAALQACSQARASDAAGHCSMLNLRRWAQLDPANAAPWLALGSEAAALGDASMLGEAMHQVAHAHTVDVYWGVLPHVLMQALPAGEPLLTRTLLTVEAWSAQAVLALPLYQVATRHCAAAQLRDANRWQLCNGIAGVLTERGRSTFDLDVGATLGQQLGWPAERTDAIRAERAALAGLAPRLVDATGISCAGIRRFAEAAELMALYGELGAYRIMALQSGRANEELAPVLRPLAAAAAPRPASAPAY